MLSFTDICDQLGSDALNGACDWAASNPAVALGLTVGGTLLATVGGLYWSSNRQAQPVVVPRMQQTRGRQSLREAITGTDVDFNLVNEIADMEKAEKMPLQTIVGAYLQQKAIEKSMNTTQIRNWVLAQAFPEQRVMGKAISQAEMNKAVLQLLGLPADGKVPTLSAGRKFYNDVLETLDLAHLKAQIKQSAKIS